MEYTYLWTITDVDLGLGLSDKEGETGLGQQA